MLELKPNLPASAATEALGQALAEAPRPAGFADFLQGWLPTLPATGLPPAEWRRLQVAGLVLLDLTRQGWLFAADAPGQWQATPPNTAFPEDRPATERPAPAEMKQQLRKALQLHRDEQLREPRIQQFVGRMEALRRYLVLTQIVERCR